MSTVEGNGRAGTALLERERELTALSEMIDAAATGSAGLLFVEGPAGIGKSRLLTELRLRAADRGFTVASARGSELERDFPFGVVRQLFEAMLADEDRAARLCRGAAAAVDAIFGLHGGRFEDDGSFAALHGLYWLTANICDDGPLLVAVDDLHWCDRSSLRYLAFLARRLEGLPLLVAGSLRPSEPGADQALLSELTSDPQAEMLTPGPLSADAAAEVVRRRLGESVDPAFAEACHASTRGNPLLLNELLKALVADRVTPDASNVDVVSVLGPRAASRAVLLRLARLSGHAVKVARAMAMLGDGADLAALEAVVDLDADAVAVATRELVQAEILRPEPPLGFVHPLVEAAVYRDLSPTERELEHERAARALLALGVPAEQVVPHVLAMPARAEGWVVEILRAAARSALERGAPDAAISSLRRALDEGPVPDVRTELLLELGQAQALTSLPAAAGDLRAAFEVASEPTLRGLAGEGLARALIFMEQPDEGAHIARRAGLELPAGHEDLSHRLEALEHLSLFFGARSSADRLERLRARRTVDATKGVGAKMLAAVAAWEWTESAGTAEDVVALSRAALAGGALVAADPGLMSVVAILPLALADLDEAVDHWEGIRAEAYRRGSMFAISGVQLWGGYTRLLRGELAEAETELRASLETLAMWGIPSQSQWTSAFLAELLVDRGAVGEARAFLDRISPAPPSSDMAILLDRAHMTVLLAEGRATDALDLAAAYSEHAGWKRHPRYVPWRSLKAQALDRLGRQEEAVALAEQEVEIAREWGSSGTVGRSLRILGTIERGDGIAHLEEACELLAGAPALVEQARALAALGSVLRHARKPTEAREPLRRALELAELTGAGALEQEVRAEIYATGARPRTTALQGVASLTASERRVAQLAASGQTNRDIAQSLYVTPKTVEVHLSNSYRKLGIGSRRDLARALEAA